MTNIETTIETLSGSSISVGTTQAVVVSAFAAYGLFSAGRDTSKKVRQIIKNRRDKKDESPKVEQTPEA